MVNAYDVCIGRKYIYCKEKQRALLATCFQAAFLPDLFFDPAEEGDKFLRNVF
jgi:hypothetical protein